MQGLVRVLVVTVLSLGLFQVRASKGAAAAADEQSLVLTISGAKEKEARLVFPRDKYFNLLTVKEAYSRLPIEYVICDPQSKAELPRTSLKPLSDFYNESATIPQDYLFIKLPWAGVKAFGYCSKTAAMGSLLSRIFATDPSGETHWDLAKAMASRTIKRDELLSSLDHLHREDRPEYHDISKSVYLTFSMSSKENAILPVRLRLTPEGRLRVFFLKADAKAGDLREAIARTGHAGYVRIICGPTYADIDDNMPLRTTCNAHMTTEGLLELTQQKMVQVVAANQHPVYMMIRGDNVPTSYEDLEVSIKKAFWQTSGTTSALRFAPTMKPKAAIGDEYMHQPGKTGLPIAVSSPEDPNPATFVRWIAGGKEVITIPLTHKPDKESPKETSEVRIRRTLADLSFPQLNLGLCDGAKGQVGDLATITVIRSTLTFQGHQGTSFDHYTCENGNLSKSLSRRFGLPKKMSFRLDGSKIDGITDYGDSRLLVIPRPGKVPIVRLASLDDSIDQIERDIVPIEPIFRMRWYKAKKVSELTNANAKVVEAIGKGIIIIGNESLRSIRLQLPEQQGFLTGWYDPETSPFWVILDQIVPMGIGAAPELSYPWGIDSASPMADVEKMVDSNRILQFGLPQYVSVKIWSGKESDKDSTRDIRVTTSNELITQLKSLPRTVAICDENGKEVQGAVKFDPARFPRVDAQTRAIELRQAGFVNVFLRPHLDPIIVGVCERSEEKDIFARLTGLEESPLKFSSDWKARKRNTITEASAAGPVGTDWVTEKGAAVQIRLNPDDQNLTTFYLEDRDRAVVNQLPLPTDENEKGYLCCQGDPLSNQPGEEGMLGKSGFGKCTMDPNTRVITMGTKFVKVFRNERHLQIRYCPRQTTYGDVITYLAKAWMEYLEKEGIPKNGQPDARGEIILSDPLEEYRKADVKAARQPVSSAQPLLMWFSGSESFRRAKFWDSPEFKYGVASEPSKVEDIRRSIGHSLISLNIAQEVAAHLLAFCGAGGQELTDNSAVVASDPQFGTDKIQVNIGSVPVELFVCRKSTAGDVKRRMRRFLGLHESIAVSLESRGQTLTDKQKVLEKEPPLVGKIGTGDTMMREWTVLLASRHPNRPPLRWAFPEKPTAGKIFSTMRRPIRLLCQADSGIAPQGPESEIEFADHVYAKFAALPLSWLKVSHGPDIWEWIPYCNGQDPAGLTNRNGGALFKNPSGITLPWRPTRLDGTLVTELEPVIPSSSKQPGSYDILSAASSQDHTKIRCPNRKTMASGGSGMGPLRTIIIKWADLPKLTIGALLRVAAEKCDIPRDVRVGLYRKDAGGSYSARVPLPQEFAGATLDLIIVPREWSIWWTIRLLFWSFILSCITVFLLLAFVL